MLREIPTSMSNIGDKGGTTPKAPGAGFTEEVKHLVEGKEPEANNAGIEAFIKKVNPPVYTQPKDPIPVIDPGIWIAPPDLP